MNISDLKRYFFLPSIYFICFIFISSQIAQAADIQAQLDNTTGSGLSVQNSSSVEVARISNGGDLVAHGNVGVGTSGTGGVLLYVSPQGVPPLYAAAGDAYIQNNLEVDGTTYLNDVFINGLEVNGLTFTGQPSLNSLAVTGGAFLGLTSGNNVGIGTSSPGSKLTVDGGVSIGTGLNYIDTLAPANGLIVQGNVGIGSLAPGQALDVQGEVRTTAFTMSGQTPVSGYVLTASDGNGDTTWTAAGTVAGWTVSGNNVYETDMGNVGIGSVNPGQALDVQGTVRSLAFTTNGAYTQSGNSANILSGTTTFIAAGASALFANNVGIGSTVPGQALDVQGEVRTTAFTMSGQTPVSGYVLTASDGNGDTTWTAAGTVAGWTVSGNNVYETDMGNVGIGSVTPGQALDVQGTVRSTAFTTNGAYTQSGLSSNTFTGVSTFSNATNSALFTGGNVGIGSLTPGQLLDVQGEVRTTAFTMSGQTPVSGYVLTASDGNGDTTWTAAGTVAGWTVSGNNVYETDMGNVGIGSVTPGQALDVQGTVRSTAFTTNGAYTQSGNSLNTLSGTTTFSATGTSALFTGNVGIASTAPGQALDVQGTVRSTAFTTNGSYTQSGLSSNTFTGVSTFNNATNSALFTGGNVGIGSLAPGQKLDVQGTVRAIGFTMSGQTPVSGYVLTASDGNGDTTWSSAGTVAGWTVSGNNVYETDMGNVGIGSVTPGQALDVQGTVRSTAFTTNGAYTQSGLSSNTFTGVSTFNNATNSALFTGGNVGIGSTAPGQKLDVQGTVRAIGFTMSGQTPVSGYVLTASDGNGDTTWSSAGTVAGWTVSGNNVYETDMGNVGIGSVTPGQALDVQGTVRSTAFTTNGAYTQSGLSSNTFTGVSTFNNATNSALFTGGNVGIGSTAPGQKLDVQGTVRTTGFTMSGQTPVSGYVLTASDGSGDTTWTAAGTVAGWTVSGNNVYETDMGNVGIGSVTPGQALDVQGTVRSTAFTTNGAYTQSGNSLNTLSGTTTFSATGTSALFTGNVGIASTAPGQALDVQGTVRSTAFTTNGAYTQSGLSSNTFTGVSTFNNATNSALFTGGNVGIGSIAPGQELDVQGTVRTTGFTMSGQTPVSGYVLTASDGSGDTTWTAAGTVAGWTVSGNNVYETDMGNVGIGSVTPGQALDVQGTVRSTAFTTNGAYTQSGLSSNTFTGVSTFNNATNSALFTGGNVGIGSTAPGQELDVQGTVRTTGFTMSGQTPVSGYVLTASDGNGDTTWTAAGTVAGWTVSGNDVYETGMGNVGIGSVTPGQALDVQGTVRSTAFTTNGAYTQSGLSSNTFTGVSTFNNATNSALFTGGNVGIGSVVPGQLLDVQGTVRSTAFTTNGAYTQSGLSSNTFTGVSTFNNATNSALFTGGNVGIGSLTPGQELDVQGTVRTTGFTMSGQTPVSGYVLTASDGSGDTTWTAAGTVAGWTVSGNNVYETSLGNVGIGTTTVNQGALVVTNGNVGIGTWAPAGALIVQGGNVGIGTAFPGTVLDVNGTVRITGTNSLNLGSDNRASIAASAATTPDIRFLTNSSEVMRITNGGNVGINTSTPVNSLDINNNSAIGVHYAGIKTAPPNGLIVEGNVGIGTASPQTGLAVLGNVGIGTWTGENGKLIVMGGNVGIGTNVPPVLFAAGNGIPVNATAPDDSYFGHDIEVKGNVYANAIIGGETLTGDIDLGGYFLKSNQGPLSNGTVLIHGGLGVDTADLVVAPNSFVGIGTVTPVSRLTVNGGVAIGAGYLTTLAPTNGLMVQGNVGIGSLAPGQALDVQGEVRTTAFTMSGQTPVSGYVLTASDGSGDTTWTAAGTVAGWTISGNNIYETNTSGNVGIGSVTPGQALDVQGTVRSTAFTTSGAYTQSGLSSNTFTGVSTFNNATNSALFTGGNVGIGSVVPGQLLDVQGTVRSTAFTTNGAYTQSGLSSNTFTGVSTFSNATNSALFTGGNVGIGSLTPGQLLDVQGEVRTTAFTMSGQTPVSGYVLTASDGNGDTTWTAAGTVAGWTVSGNNVYETDMGNVGIGSVTPGQALDVQGTVRSTAFTTNGAYTQSGNSLNTLSGTTTFSATGTSALFTGNVGIASTAPGQALDVQGTVRSTAFTTNGSYTQSGLSSNTFTGVSTFNNATNSALFTGGNVGIGSTAPGQKLDVQGTVRTTGFTMSGQTPVSGYVLTASDGNGDTTWTAAGTVAGWTVSGNNVYETDMGNVGIGSVTPGQALDVQGTVRSTAFTTNGAYTQSGLSSNTFTGVSTFNNATNSALFTGGNVGIGSVVPGQLLDVQGTVRSTAFVTNGSYTQSGNGANILSGTTTFSALGTSAAFTNNVGIGSTAPGQALDVQGTVRTTGFTMSGQTPVSGYVLTASDGNGDTTWTAAGTVAGWTISGNNIYETNTSGNVGIGSVTPGQALDVQGTVRSTAFTTNGAYTQSGNSLNTLSGTTTFSATGTSALFTGNVGIASTAPGQALDVQGTVRSTAFTTNGAYTQSGLSSNTFTGVSTFNNATNSALFTGGNVGIGSLTPGQELDVQGTVRTTGFTMSGQTPVSGYVLTASDGNGDTTWTAAGTVAGWTVSGNDVYETALGNVGIGTTITSAGAALSVMNGNVGIGTWVPAFSLDVKGVGNFGSAKIYGDNATDLYVGPGASTSGGSSDTALGANASAGGTFATVIGYNANANGYNSLALGEGAQATQNTSIAIGAQSNSSNQFSTVIGYAVTSTADYQLILGGFNGIESSHAVENWVTITPTATANAPKITLGAVAGTNVGIGSLNPGQALDVQGTVRTTGFTMSGQTPVSGYVLTASDGNGDTTWTAAGTVAGWTVSGNNVYETDMGNVGIGSVTPGQALDVQGTVRSTAFTTNGAYTQSGLSSNTFTGVSTFNNATNSALFTGGNVGIGSVVPGQLLDVQGTVRSTAFVTNGSYTQSGNGANILSGTTTFSALGTSAAFTNNVGIGSTAPGQALDVQGTVRTTGFTMSGQTPVSGYVLTASDGNGDTTWTAAGTVAGWTISGNNIYETNTSGNVGIGSVTPGQALDVQGTVRSTAFTTNGAYTQSGLSSNTFTGVSTFNNATNSALFTGGNVGIGSLTPGQELDVQGTVRTTGFTMSGQTPASGYVLTASDGAGDATWTPAGSVGPWTQLGTNVYTTGNNVGIGTTTPQGGFVVTNGNVGIGTWAPASTFSLSGSMSVTVVSKTSGYTATANDNVILVSASGGAVAITLPLASSVPGREYVIKKTDSSVNAVTISDGGSNDIDGQSSISTALQYQAYTIVSDGSSWDII